MAAFTLMREKEIRSGVPVPQVSEDDVDSQYSGGLRSWRDPRDADSASDAGAPPSGLVSEQAGYALRRNSSVFERLKAFATVLTPTNTKAKAVKPEAGAGEDATDTGAGGEKGVQQGPGSDTEGASSSGRRGSLEEGSTASGEARRRSAYNFPKWLAKRRDFEALKQDQAHCGPVFVRQALTTPGYKRRDQEVATLVKWLRQYNLFKHLHDRQLSVIARALTLSRVLPGQTLYPEKRVAYFVLTGKAHVARPGGQPQPVMPGQCLGARFWWSVVANGIQHRTTRLGRRMSQILLEAETANPDPSTVVDPRDAMVTSDGLMDRHTEQLQAAVERVYNRRGSIMGAEINEDELPEDTKAVASYSVPANVTNHKKRSRFGKLDLWVDPAQQQGRGGKQGKPRVSIAPHAATPTDDAPASGYASPQPRISIPTPTSRFSAVGHRRARTPGQLLTSDIAPLSPRSYKAAQARERRNRRRSFFDSSYSATAAPESEGGSPNGLELVRLAMGDYVEALAADKKRSQKRIMEFLGTVGYFQSWTASRLLVVAGLLEEREIPAGDFVFRQGEAVNGLCILMTGKCKLMKRVRVERTHRWPVSKKSWSVQKKKYDWNVEVKQLLPKAIIGEESTLISRKHRLALVSNYFSNAFVAQGQTPLPTRGGVKPLDNVAEAALSGIIRGGPEDDTQPVVDRFKELADQLMQHHTEATAADLPLGLGVDASSTRDLDTDAAQALRQAAKALEAVLAKKRPYSVQAEEDSVVLFLRPEHFACLYHTALMPKLRKLARVQATDAVVREAEEKRRKALTEKRKLRDQLVGERYKRKIEHRPGDPAPPPPKGPLLNVPRTDDALNTKARLTANDGLLEAYLSSFAYESRAVRDIRESQEAEEWERRRSRSSTQRTPMPRAALSASEAALMPDPHATPVTARRRPSSGASRRLRLGSARPASVQKLSAGWGDRPATGGWDQYLHVSPNRVVVRMSSAGGSRPRTSPATVVVGAFPARPGSPGFASPKSLMSKTSFAEQRLRSLASHARANSPTSRRRHGTPARSNSNLQMAMRKRTQDRNRRKPEPSPDARRGSAYAQAMKAGKIVPNLTDLALIGSEPAPVARARSPPVNARHMHGAAGHRLWEHTNMDPVAEGVAFRLALPYPTDVFQRQARVNAVEAARRQAEEAAMAAQQEAKRAAPPPTGLARATNAAAAKRANDGDASGDHDDASSDGGVQPDEEALLGREYEPNEAGVAKRFVDDSVYDDVGWWATRKVADQLNSGDIRGDTVETVEQLSKRLNVKLRWRPVRQFGGGSSGKGGSPPRSSPPPA